MVIYPADNHTREHEYLRLSFRSLSNVLRMGTFSNIVFIFLSRTVLCPAVWILWGQRLLWHRVGLKPPKVNDHTELKKEKTILITRLHVLQ